MTTRWGILGLFLSPFAMGTQWLFPKVPHLLATVVFWVGAFGVMVSLLAICVPSWRGPRERRASLADPTARQRPSIVLTGRGEATIARNHYTGRAPFLRADREGTVKVTDNTIADDRGE